MRSGVDISGCDRVAELFKLLRREWSRRRPAGRRLDHLGGKRHKHGTRLGGIVTVDDLRGRCWIDAATGCWHLRKADGQAYPPGARQMVWLHGAGSMTPTRAMWQLHKGRPVDPRYVVFRDCDSHDCVNPEHLRCATRKTLVAQQTERGHFKVAEQPAALRAMSMRQLVVTPELVQWLLESEQSGSEAAHGLGVTQSRANAIRAIARSKLRLQASAVFAMSAVGQVRAAYREAA